MKLSSGHEKFAPYISKNDRPHSSAEPWDSTNKSQSLVRYGLGEVKRYIICTVYCTKGLDGLTSPRRTPILYTFILSCSFSTVPRTTWNQHPAPWHKFKFKQCDTVKIRANHHVHFFFFPFKWEPPLLSASPAPPKNKKQKQPNSARVIIINQKSDIGSLNLCGQYISWTTLSLV